MMFDFASQSRLRWANDQCPLPGSSIPSLHHTRWYAESQTDQPPPNWQIDGFTSTVFQARWFSWYRMFTIEQPQLPPSRSLITIVEWLPRYEPNCLADWITFGRHDTSAYANLHPDYLKDWREHALRHLKKFKRANCELRLGTREEVIKLYATSQVPKHLQVALLRLLDKHLKIHPGSIDILIAEKHGQPIACHVVGNCDEAKLSEYIIGAFDPEYKHDQPMVGLIDWWYQRSLGRGYSWVTFGYMEPWGWGLPKSGNGYSLFKTHFGVQRMWFPQNRWKIIFNHKGLFTRP